MGLYSRITAAALGLVVAVSPAATRVRAPSIIPPGLLLDEGYVFGAAQSLDLVGNASLQLGLGFRARVAPANGAVYSAFFLSENGAVSFGSALPAATNAAGVSGLFQPVASLAELNTPVIATFYADLAQPTRPVNGQGVYVQYGALAGGVPGSGGAASAVRITWYGLPVAEGNPGAESNGAGLAFAQLLLTDDGGGDFSLEFRTGDPNGAPWSQDGLGSLEGFALGPNLVQFDGPYTESSPAFFSFRGGLLAPGAVPEPGAWLTMIVGFAAVGGAMRTARARTRVRFAY